MKVEINNIEVLFGASDVLGVKSWSARIRYPQHILAFEFDERELKNSWQAVKIDQKLMVDVVKHVLDNMDGIKSKASAVLTELCTQVFGKEELIRTKGYFQPEGIKLKAVRDWGDIAAGRVPSFEYEVYYFLESEINHVIDPYHSYYARFSNYNGLTLIGVSRIG